MDTPPPLSADVIKALAAALTPEQLEEIRASHPGLVAPVAEPSQEPRATKLTKAEEARYAALYRKQWRQIRRWIERGEERNDPCPLPEPAKMPTWWARNMKWRVPPEIEEAALNAARGTPAPAPQTALPDPAGTATPKASLPPGTETPRKAIDLASFDPEEGDRLRELKQIQAAKFAELSDALANARDSSLLESKYLKLSETVDKIETRVTERLKKRGLYILRADVERDLAAAAELLCRSRDSMVRRVLELCPSLSAEQRAEVSAAIDRARASEERMLSRLESLNSTDLLRELAA